MYIYKYIVCVCVYFFMTLEWQTLSSWSVFPVNDCDAANYAGTPLQSMRKNMGMAECSLLIKLMSGLPGPVYGKLGLLPDSERPLYVRIT